MIMLPGADFTVVVRNALAGRLRGAMAGLGVVCGLVLHTTLAVAGLAAVVAASPSTLVAIRYAGGAYLLYLGGRALFAARPRRAGEPRGQEAGGSRPAGGSGPALAGHPAVPGGTPVLQGFLSNALNPKAPLLFLSIMPQFVSARGAMTGPLIVMSLIVVGLGLAWFPLVALCATQLGRAVSTARRRRAFDAVTGLVLAGFATVILVAT